MKNILKLHEAIAIVLLNLNNRTGSFQEIALEIERRNLFPIRKEGITLAEQVRIRTSIKSSRYLGTWFKVMSANTIRLL